MHDEHYKVFVPKLASIGILRLKHVDRSAQKTFTIRLIDSFSRIPYRSPIFTTLMDDLADRIVLNLKKRKWSLDFEEKEIIMTAYRNYTHQSPYIDEIKQTLENYECQSQSFISGSSLSPRTLTKTTLAAGSSSSLS
jgi:hypothetical protein